MKVLLTQAALLKNKNDSRILGDFVGMAGGDALLPLAQFLSGSFGVTKTAGYVVIVAKTDQLVIESGL